MKKRKKLLYWACISSLTCVIYFGSIHVKIVKYSKMEVPKSADFLIILGAKVNGNVPSLSLQYRIDTAAEYLLANQSTIAIASGGKGPEENISEAEAIKQGLMKKGIEETRIRLENKSTSTTENIKFSKAFMSEDNEQGVIVTNDFHVYRGVSIAKDHNLVVTGLAAKTPKVVLVKSYVREYLAVTKYYLEKLFVR